MSCRSSYSRAMQDRRRLLLRVFLIAGGTLVAIPVSFYLPVLVAMVIRGLPGGTGPSVYSGAMWGGYCCGSLLVLMTGFIGFHNTIRAIIAYINAEPTDACLRCQYPLRNLPADSITCPECGFVIPSTSERRSRAAKEDKHEGDTP